MRCTMPKEDFSWDDVLTEKPKLKMMRATVTDTEYNQLKGISISKGENVADYLAGIIRSHIRKQKG